MFITKWTKYEYFRKIMNEITGTVAFLTPTKLHNQ